MSGRVEDAAAKVAGSVRLQALSRIAVPILIPVVLWTGNELWSLEKRMVNTEVRLGAIEETTKSGGSNDDRAAATAVAVLAAGQQNMLRLLDQMIAQINRLEARIDAQVVHTQPPPR